MKPSSAASSQSPYHNNRLSVCVAADERFAQYAGTMLFSLARHYQGNSLTVYYIEQGLSKRSKYRTENVLAPFNINLAWIKAPSDLNKLPTTRWTTPITHARMFLAELLPAENDVVLYLDSDMLVLNDVGTLLRNGFPEHTISACIDSYYPTIGSTQSQSLFRDFGIDPDSRYFNAGLIIFRLEKFRKKDYLNEYIRLVCRYGKKFSHGDQDVMNLLFSDKWKTIDGHWNTATFEVNSKGLKLEDISILHFTGRKPCQKGCKNPYKKLYFEYLRQSGWFTQIGYHAWYTRLKYKTR